MDNEEGQIIELDKYRRQRQKSLEGNGLKERFLRGGARIVLGGLGAGFLFMGVYGTIKFFSSEPTPREVYRDVNRGDQPLPIERVFLPLEEELIEYIHDDNKKEGVMVRKLGYRVFYMDTNGDLSVDKIVIDDLGIRSSHLEERVDNLLPANPWGYGTELLRREREKYLDRVDQGEKK